MLSSFNIWNKFISMQTMRNKHFCLTKHQLFTWLYLPLKHFIGHGSLVLNVRSTSDLLLPSKPHIQRSTSIMRRQQNHRPTFWQWVRHRCSCPWQALIIVSPQSEGEDVIFQEALVNGTSGWHHEMCRRSGKWNIVSQLGYMLTFCI